MTCQLTARISSLTDSSRPKLNRGNPRDGKDRGGYCRVVAEAAILVPRRASLPGFRIRWQCRVGACPDLSPGITATPYRIQFSVIITPLQQGL